MKNEKKQRKRYARTKAGRDAVTHIEDDIENIEKKVDENRYFPNYENETK